MRAMELMMMAMTYVDEMFCLLSNTRPGTRLANSSERSKVVKKTYL